MENGNQFDKLLIRYLSDEADAKEIAVAEEWISASAQNRQYFKELEETWRMMVVLRESEKIDVEHEWSRFVEARQNSGAPSSIQPERRERSIVRKLFVAVAVAASVAIVVAGLVMLFDKKKNHPQLIVRSVTDTLKSFVRNEKNLTGKEKTIVLQDGSQVLLYSNSELTFREPFSDDRRDITLTGMAEFTVAKDSTRPFTVFSGDISTKALGTKFLVTAFRGAGNITVRLFEGKILVRRINRLRDSLKDDYYLSAGQEFIYDQQNMTARVKRFGGKNMKAEDMISENQPASDNPTIPLNEKGNWYMFNNQSLAQVFDQLQQMYSVKIEYIKEDISDKYFIGKFDKSDSIERILRQIAIVNNLKISKESDRFVVRK